MGPIVSTQVWRRAPGYRLEPRTPEERQAGPPEEWFIVPTTHDERKWEEVDVLGGSKEHPLWLDFVNLAKPLHGFWPVGSAPIERLENFAQRALDFAGRWGLLGLYDGAVAAGGLFGGGDEALWSPEREGQVARALWERSGRSERVPPHHVESVTTWAGLVQELSGLLEPMLPKQAQKEKRTKERRWKSFRMGDSRILRSYGTVRLEPVVVKGKAKTDRHLQLRMVFDWLLPAMVYLAILEVHQGKGKTFQLCSGCGNAFLARRADARYCERCRLGEAASKGSKQRQAFRVMLAGEGLQGSAPPRSVARNELWEAYRTGGPDLLRQRAREMGLLRA